jgi:hypothetical protein
MQEEPTELEKLIAEREELSSILRSGIPLAGTHEMLTRITSLRERIEELRKQNEQEA